jgi:quinoprotein dehydrogenase-associated probable ABC transporter substrate-binding protein
MSSRFPKRFIVSLLALVTLALLLDSCGSRAQHPAQHPAQNPAQTQAQQAQATATPSAGPKFERPPHVLRVCADPNNLPFSNKRGEGFENKLAELLAKDLDSKVEYTWWAQRRGFFRNTLKAGVCDVVMGVPSSFEPAATTAPYYRSTYVFVYRKGHGLQVGSFDDPVLHQVKVGVQLVGDDGADTPPAHALAARGVIQNVHGYTLYGDYSQENPPARIVEAVAKGEVDVAVVWGPLAGYFAKRARTPLEVVPVAPQVDLPFLPFVYDISIGFRRGDDAFKAELEQFIERRRPEIERILDEYGIPRVAKDDG